MSATEEIEKTINLDIADKDELLEMINHWKNKCLEANQKYDELEKKFEEREPCLTCKNEPDQESKQQIQVMQNQLKEAFKGLHTLQETVSSSTESRNRERIEVLDQYGRKNSLKILKLVAPEKHTVLSSLYGLSKH